MKEAADEEEEAELAGIFRGWTLLKKNFFSSGVDRFDRFVESVSREVPRSSISRCPSIFTISGDVGRVALVSVRKGWKGRVRAVGRQVVRIVSQWCGNDGGAIGCHKGSADNRAGCWCGSWGGGGGRGGRGERQEAEQAEL